MRPAQNAFPALRTEQLQLVGDTNSLTVSTAETARTETALVEPADI